MLNETSNMKILMIARIRFDHPTEKGIVAKLQGQQKGFQQLGYKTDLLHLYQDGIYLNDKKILSKNLSDSPQTKWYFFKNLFKDILKSIDIQSYDMLYIRYPMSTPSFIDFLRKVKYSNSRSKIFIELPTYPYDMEKRGGLGKLITWIDHYYREKLYKYVYRLVHFGSETKVFNIPVINIQNGIDPHLYPLRKTPVFNNELRLLAVGGLWNWFGIDRIIEGLINYYQNNPSTIVKLTIVGNGPELSNLKELARPLVQNVQFKGELYGQELDNLFNSHHLAVGKLAMHRIGLNYSSSLKHREYLVRGIPFIYSGIDLGLGSTSYAFQHDESDNPINLKNLVHQYKSSLITKSTSRKDIIENLSWSSILKKILISQNS